MTIIFYTECRSILKKIPRTPLPNKAYRNLGNLQFDDIGNSWGFTQPSFSNGAAYADLDNDGDLDLVINNEKKTTDHIYTLTCFTKSRRWI